MATTDRPAGPAPDRARLHEAALRHLARYATTEAGLIRVLDRRVWRWARAASAEGEPAELGPGGGGPGGGGPGGRGPVDGQVQALRQTVREVAQALVRAGVVDDAAFAAARSASLARAGRSRRAVAAHLAAKGVAPDVAEAALPEPEREFLSALTYARKRRLGPFCAAADPADRLPALGRLARAGYSRDVAERVLDLSPAEAEALALALRQG